MTGLLRGVRQVGHYWLQKPAYTLIIIAMLSVGLGVNAGVLSFARAVLVEAIPFDDADRIVHLFEDNVDQNVEEMASSIPTYLDWLTSTSSFEAMGASSAPVNVVLQSGDRYQRLRSTLVTPSFFRVTGGEPVRGRLFDEGDDVRPGGHPVAVISEEFWRSHFDRDPSAVGATLALNGTAYVVIGVWLFVIITSM